MAYPPGRSREPQVTAAPRWLFANAVLDERSLTLTIDGQIEALDRKPLEVLRHLLNHAGEVVTKDELLAAVWPGRILSDAGLTSCVARLRAALRDDTQAIIKTVHGYGYRLVAPVRVEATTAVPPPRFDFKPGDSPHGHPNWKLVECLGTGGHGEVWLARQDKTGEPRIFKYALDMDALPSLKREITLSRYLHDTLGAEAPFVRIVDWNLDAPPYCIQAEYTHGGNLVRWAEAQGGMLQVPLATRLELAIRIADALASAHAVGVLHKDLKPSNVLLDTRGDGVPRVLLSDFGSGGVLDPGKLDALGITRMGLTMTRGMSATSGTPIYLAPELIAEQPATMQTDIYAMGVLLYQLVVGDLKRPLAPGWEHDVPDELLREDIAAAAAGNPSRRLDDASRLVARLRNLPQRRSELAAAAGTRRRMPRALIAAGVATLSLALAWFAHHRRDDRTAAPSGYGLVVLPFASPAKEVEAAGFTAGLFEEVSVALRRVKPLRTAPRSIVQAYQGTDLDAPAIARELNADAVLLTEVDRRAGRLRIDTRLVRADGSTAWAQKYDRPMADLFVVQDDLVREVAAALHAPVADAAIEAIIDRGTGSIEAYDLYLQAKGRGFGSGVTTATLDEQLAQLHSATRLDPLFARAYALLATGYQARVYWNTPDDRASLKNGFAAAEHALGLRPDLIEAHVAKAMLGMTPMNGFDFTLGIREAKRALVLDEEYLPAWGPLSVAYSHVGLFEESERVMARVSALTPHDMTHRLNVGAFQVWAGQPQRGLDLIEATSPRQVQVPRLWYWIGAWALMDLGRHMQAEARIGEFLQHNQDVGGLLTGRRALLHAIMGQPALAEQDIAAAAANPPYGHFHHTAYEIGATYAVLGRPAEAVTWLSQAARTGFPNYPVFARDRNLDKVRRHPDFVKLMESLRRQFAEYQALAAAPPD